MSKLGDIPVPVTLTRDQVRLIRYALADGESDFPEDFPREKLTQLREQLNMAEDRATIQHAKGYSHFDLWE
jgi:hypothetical protein